VILHRLRLTNFRGIAERELTFPDHGVVVVCGPNEVGKSSMLEALDLLLEHKDRSSKQKVMAAKPTHADVGAEVEAEISSGPYRFVYRKRFHKKHLTELTVLEPQRRPYSGDEAHERVRAMLDETVDTGLWQAQRVLQAASTTAVDLSGCDALSRALDVAAGDADSSGNDAPLIDAIDAEFERYFTPSAGRPAREWKDAIERLAAAQREVEGAGAAVARGVAVHGHQVDGAAETVRGDTQKIGVPVEFPRPQRRRGGHDAEHRRDRRHVAVDRAGEVEGRGPGLLGEPGPLAVHVHGDQHGDEGGAGQRQGQHERKKIATDRKRPTSGGVRRLGHGNSGGRGSGGVNHAEAWTIVPGAASSPFRIGKSERTGTPATGRPSRRGRRNAGRGARRPRQSARVMKVLLGSTR
jgi:energy-coupling factor transporter ATP-binding protein EcfA2